MGDPVLCPDCGWTGEETDLDAGDCPVCATDVEVEEGGA
jgi:hypothetical protein